MTEIPAKPAPAGIKKLIYVDTAASTQDIGKSFAADGEAEGTLIIAGTQTSGRGRLERVWESPAGGLYMSLILRPNSPVETLGNLSIKTAETVSATIEKLYGIKTKIKSPNDVLVFNAKKDKYLKVSGILTESSTAYGRPEWVVMGIGVNLNNEIAKSLPDATSLKQVCGKTIDPDKFMSALFPAFWRTYSEWELAALSKL